MMEGFLYFHLMFIFILLCLPLPQQAIQPALQEWSLPFSFVETLLLKAHLLHVHLLLQLQVLSFPSNQRTNFDTK